MVLPRSLRFIEVWLLAVVGQTPAAPAASDTPELNQSNHHGLPHFMFTETASGRIVLPVNDSRQHKSMSPLQAQYPLSMSMVPFQTGHDALQPVQVGIVLGPVTGKTTDDDVSFHVPFPGLHFVETRAVGGCYRSSEVELVTAVETPLLFAEFPDGILGQLERDSLFLGPAPSSGCSIQNPPFNRIPVLHPSLVLELGGGSAATAIGSGTKLCEETTSGTSPQRHRLRLYHGIVVRVSASAFRRLRMGLEPRIRDLVV